MGGEYIQLCTRITKTILPGVRAAVAERLRNDDYTEEEISDILGIAQAAVSKYLNGKYTNDVKRVKEKAISIGLEKKITRYITRGESKIKIGDAIDRACVDPRLLRLL